MKFWLLLMFVAAALAKEEDEVTQLQLARSFSNLFNITEEESLECIQNSGVTRADMRYMEDSIDVTSEREIMDMKVIRRASCALVCAAQKQGTMVGKEINLNEVYKYLHVKNAPEHIRNKLVEWTSTCKVEAENETDECIVGYKFAKCVYIKSLSEIEAK